LNAVRREKTIGTIEDARPYDRKSHSLRYALSLHLRRIRWAAIFIYGASAAFGLAFWLLVLKFATHGR
jgi:hypothetical protein